MKVVVFDCETTGLRAKDEVVQFSALLLDESLRLERVYNFYCNTQVPFEPKASEITHLDADNIRILSNGKFFEDYYWVSELFKLKDVIWCGYNVSFDIRKINSTLENNGLSPHNFGNKTVTLNKTDGTYYFDVMQLCRDIERNTYSISLDQCVSKLPYSERQLTEMYLKLQRIANMQTTTKFHNSLWDSMVTWLYLAKYKGRCC